MERSRNAIKSETLRFSTALKLTISQLVYPIYSGYLLLILSKHKLPILPTCVCFLDVSGL